MLCCVAVPAGAAVAWPQAPAPVERLVEEALRSNLALGGENLEVERAAAQLDAARGAFLPRLDANARYSEATGGRTIDVPVGDLLNGAYSTLNQLLAAEGQAARFSPVANQSIPFLRTREQQTSLTLTQPLYRPEISRGSRAAKAGLEARKEQRAAFRRQLRADVQEAYFRHEQTVGAVAIYRDALALVQESLRVNRSLFDNGRTTEDTVLRAQAEEAAVEQQIEEALRDEDTARSYVNFLLNRRLETAVDPLGEEASEAYAGALRQADAAGVRSEGREELAALEHSRAAAKASADAVRARELPSLGLAVEGGIQGSGYEASPGRNYAVGSLVLDWNLFDGLRTKSEIAQARVDERQAERQLDQTSLELELQLRQARTAFAAAQKAVVAARLRREAAQENYRIIARREAEGAANQVTVLDARTTLTSSQLNYAITRARLCIAAARLDQAATLSAAP